MKTFDIRKYLEDNKIELGKYETTESHNVAKGISDIRKTNHTVNIVDGKFQLDTLKKVIIEGKQLNEGSAGTREIAEIFARFLIGDRPAAIKQLQSKIKVPYGQMEKGGTREWNDQFRDLINKLEHAINSAL